MRKIASAPVLSAIGRALPASYYDQQTLTSALWNEWGGDAQQRNRLERFHRAAGVKGRHLAIPVEEYSELTSFAKANDRWVQRATELGEEAVLAALAQADLSPTDIDHIFFTTVTGIASPSIDARLVNRLSMRPNVKRTPIFGLGCVGGVAGLARAADYLRAFPQHNALVLSVELCSLTLQLTDQSIANLIASGLFGDGAAAAVLTGHARREGFRSPKILASQSAFFPETEKMMGWQVTDAGFRIVLSAGVPNLVRKELRGAVDSLLEQHELCRSDITHWVAHTGGPKVLEAMEEALDVPRSALERSWNSLSEIGNLSSASVLFVAADLLESNVARPGDYGVLLAMGPGFCGEVVLVEW